MPTARQQWAALQRSRQVKPAGKYRNKVTRVDGIRFDSKLEADRYVEILLLRKTGIVLWFLRQVPFDVASGVVYRADFLIVWNRTGTPQECVTIEDCKGVLTPTSRVKIAVVQERYGINVKLLTRKDVRRA